MSAQELEERVRALEREMADLKSRLSESGAVKDWRRSVGAFRGDAVMRRIVEAGQAIRAGERSQE